MRQHLHAEIGLIQIGYRNARRGASTEPRDSDQQNAISKPGKRMHMFPQKFLGSAAGRKDTSIVHNYEQGRPEPQLLHRNRAILPGHGETHQPMQ